MLTVAIVIARWIGIQQSSAGLAFALKPEQIRKCTAV